LREGDFPDAKQAQLEWTVQYYEYTNSVEILKTALYVGAVGYGGPAILALMKRVIVHEKGWVSDEEFMNVLSLSQILPGATG
jgi:chromate transport protein ChrA